MKQFDNQIEALQFAHAAPWCLPCSLGSKAGFESAARVSRGRQLNKISAGTWHHIPTYLDVEEGYRGKWTGLFGLDHIGSKSFLNCEVMANSWCWLLAVMAGLLDSTLQCPKQRRWDALRNFLHKMLAPKHRNHCLGGSYCWVLVGFGMILCHGVACPILQFLEKPSMCIIVYPRIWVLWVDFHGVSWSVIILFLHVFAALPPKNI